MKSSTSSLSVGIGGFLKHRMTRGIDDSRSGQPAGVGWSTKNPQRPDSEPDIIPDNSRRDRLADDRATWAGAVAPDSRRPLVPPEVRAKIEAIECDARGMGWPPELLWNANFWDLPRGLAAVLDADDEIAEVTPEYVVILKSRRELLRFRRHVS
jgi:hypothetical protein